MRSDYKNGVLDFFLVGLHQSFISTSVAVINYEAVLATCSLVCFSKTTLQLPIIG